MLAKENRLTQSSDFKLVKESGRLTSGDLFSLASYNRKDNAPSRFGFVVSKSTSKNASKRNMIKRALSESLRQEIAFIKKGFDSVFLVKPKAASSYMPVLMGEVKNMIRKAGLTK